MSAALNIKRDCQHKRVHHQHGTLAAYKTDRCRCPDCRSTNTRAVKAQRAGIRSKDLNGLRRNVPAEQARNIVRALRNAGYGHRQIAKAGQFGTTRRVQNIMVEPPDPKAYTTVSPETLHKCERAHFVLTHSNQPRSGWHSVDGTGTRRRFQALATLGYSRDRIADMTGTSPSTVAAIQAGERTRVANATADAAVKALRHALTVAPPQGLGPEITRRKAQENRYVPAAAWEEDAAMDDPDATPLPRGEWFRYHDRDVRLQRARTRQEKAA